jgi:hypothetical protein
MKCKYKQEMVTTSTNINKTSNYISHVKSLNTTHDIFRWKSWCLLMWQSHEFDEYPTQSYTLISICEYTVLYSNFYDCQADTNNDTFSRILNCNGSNMSQWFIPVRKNKLQGQKANKLKFLTFKTRQD